jgi:hypothetical protein
VDAALAQSLFAGWVAGAVAGMASTVALIIGVVRTRVVASRLPWANRPVILAIVMANALTFGLTLVGLVLGAVFHRTGVEDPQRFGIVVAVATVVIVGFYVFVRGGIRAREAPVVLVCLVVSGLSFSLLLPWLGTLDR